MESMRNRKLYKPHLIDGAVSRGDWYAPRLLAFSMAMASPGGVTNPADVDGRQPLANGDLSAGMAHWVFSSYHMPWHIKSRYMNVLFDQGLLGTALWGMLLVGAPWRTSLGGFAVIGLFDSLVDVPRAPGFFTCWCWWP
jgi:hypothetical protein